MENVLRICPSVMCNLRCSYCINKQYITQKKLDIHVDKIVNFVKTFDPTEVLIDGTGEPTLCPQFAELYKKLNTETRCCTFTVCTNAKARDLAWWRDCLSYRNRAKLTKLIMSIHFAQNNFEAVKNLTNFAYKQDNVFVSNLAVLSKDSVPFILNEFNKNPLALRNILFQWDCNMSDSEVYELKMLLGSWVLSNLWFKPEYRKNTAAKTQYYGRNMTALYIDRHNTDTFRIIKTDEDLNETLLGVL